MQNGTGTREEGGLDDPRIVIYERLFEAWDNLSRLLDAQLEREIGLPLTWYGVLLYLGRSPEGYRPIGDLGAVTAFTSGGITRLVDRMQEAGYVERQRCPTDRRVIYVALTEAGRDLLRRATAVQLRGIQQHLVDRLEAEELARLSHGLAKLAAG